MGTISDKRAVELSWNEVCYIVSDEIEELLGLRVQCKANVVEDEFWDVKFIDYRLPLPRLCQLLQATQATLKEWVDALPAEGGVDVNCLGILLSEKLVARHLRLTWAHSLITSDSLWLVDVSSNETT